MIIKLPLKPLSINAAFQGRRFKTKECNQYCKDVQTLLPSGGIIKGFVQIHYKFYLKNWKMTDGDNLVKILTDCIVQKGLIEDDRKIMRYTIEKYQSTEDRIELDIDEYCAFENGGQLLSEIIKIFGWKGGTIHQVIDEIKRLKKNSR